MRNEISYCCVVWCRVVGLGAGGSASAARERGEEKETDDGQIERIVTVRIKNDFG